MEPQKTSIEELRAIMKNKERKMINELQENEEILLVPVKVLIADGYVFEIQDMPTSFSLTE